MQSNLLYNNYLATEKTDTGTISVLTYNIGYANGPESLTRTQTSKKAFELNLESIANTLKSENPTLAAFQEIDVFSKRSCFIDQVAHIANKAEYPSYSIAFTWDRTWVPYPFFTFPKYQFGKTLAANVIFSKIPLLNQRVFYFKKPQKNNFIYNYFYLERLIQLNFVHLNKKLTAIINLHFEAYNNKARQIQLKALNKLLTNLNIPYIVCGDFNQPLNSNTKPFTFPSKSPIEKLDHILFNFHFFSLLDCKTITAKQPPSDHLALLSRLQVLN